MSSAIGRGRTGDAVEEAVEEAVEDVDQARAEAVEASKQAAAARAEALEASEQAGEARDEAVDARADVVAVASDDPLLDTAVRRIEAQVSDAHPYGRPGRPLSSRSPFRLAFSASLGVALAYLLVQSVLSARNVLVLLLISAFLAIGLNPVVEWFGQHGLARGKAVAVVFLAVVAGFVGFGFAVVPPIVEQATAFGQDVPAYLEDLQDNRRIAALEERFGLLEQAQGYLERGDVGTRLFGGIIGVGRFVFSTFFSALTVLILTLYFLSSFNTIKATAYRTIPRSRRARVGLLTDEILGRVGGYLAGAATISAIAGTSTLIWLTALDVPYPLALALLVALLDLVPLVGATLGAVIVTIVALFVSLPVGIATAIFFLVYQQLENYLIYPRVMKRSVDVSPAATVTAVLIGGTLLGVVGALLAIPVTAALQLVLHEVVLPRQDTA